ncbi:hypothetical protein [Ornithinibacillus xuwenensis]|uniref:Spore coat protein n=1 Tax=Ornithinibacillus xuwenensis TaxID=3144668 RepID=A0ABU9XLJ2_9BACI
MAILPAIDLGLMAEHLAAHQGAIQKFRVYEHNVSDPKLREIIHLQKNVMLEHVKVMLAFINPNTTNKIEVPSIESVKQQQEALQMKVSPESSYNNKWITLEAHSTAKNMSNLNYVSALMMKNQQVRNAHLEMALQQLKFQEEYERIINVNGWSYIPKATKEEQLKTYQQFLQQY